jgi:predicted esterase/catechol 2,3-dioxygenase-like lactoylglutathione lyase family enzyme
MTPALGGIHHVTAISAELAANVAFYTGMLGLRLVKVTVNFDDPSAYHLYYGDALGTPGTVLTFFIWPGAPAGRMGTGVLNAVALAIPKHSLGYWVQRLLEYDIKFDGPAARFDERVLTFRDPDGLVIELTTRAGAVAASPWVDGPVPVENAVAGIAGVTFWVVDAQPSAAFLDATLGLRAGREEGSTQRFAFPDSGDFVDVRAVPGFWSGHVAVGNIHHVAWRVADAAAQAHWSARLADAGVDVTPVRDRHYFSSIYFAEPGGVLFEIATDGPGFAIDESVAELGSRLMLPPRLERHRAEIESLLPPFPGKESSEEHASDDLLDFTHRFVTGDAELPALLLLHGTGGNEEDLLPLGPELLPGARLLSPRGKVLENGMPRFFRRLAESVFDLEDLIARTFELAAFIEAASSRYGIGPRKLVAVGYSNGANIAGSLMLLRPDLLAGAVLLRPMLPFEPEEPAGLDGVPVLLQAGRVDPIVPAESVEELAAVLARAGASVELVWAESGHQLTYDDLAVAKAWLAAHFVADAA